MKQWGRLADAVQITTKRVKPFSGQRHYLATGDLMGNEIGDIVNVDYKTKPSRADLLVNEGDIIVARMQATNKVLLIDKKSKDLIVSTGFLTLTPKKEFDPIYLKHYFRSDIFQRWKDQYCSGATQKAINNESFEKLRVPLYPLNEQKKIAKTLDKVEDILQKRKQSSDLLEKFLQAAFFDLFGDPLRNNKKWPCVRLGLLSEIQGGLQITPRRAVNPLEVPYLRVANVYRDKLVLDEIKNIRVTESELERTRLMRGDILVVEGHGNKEEIGRTAVWDGSINPCCHQNHLIRVRLNRAEAEPTYVSFYLNSQGGRAQLFKMRKTTSGLNTISTSNVKHLNIVLPPLEVQKKYEVIATRVEKMKTRIDIGLNHIENQMNSLMQIYFGQND